MKKYVLLLICIILLCSIGVSGCISYDDTESKNQYFFSLTIHASETCNYTVYAPVPTGYESYTQMENLIENLKFESGSGEFSILWTKHGPALNVRSIGPLVLTSRISNSDEYQRLGLSMITEETSTDIEKHWFWYMGETDEKIEVEIYLECSAGECCSERITEKTAPNPQKVSSIGWQHIITEYQVF
jgi:hypothetical protein